MDHYEHFEKRGNTIYQSSLSFSSCSIHLFYLCQHWLKALDDVFREGRGVIIQSQFSLGKKIGTWQGILPFPNSLSF